jgi:hypothetical protein
MKINCNAEGLKLAIEDALEQMDDGGADGFVYEIGSIRGQKLNISLDPDVDCYETLIMEGPLCYEAVCEVEDE